LKNVVIDETEPTIPDEIISTHQMKETEPSLPSLITEYKITKMSKEPQIPEIAYTSLKTREPKPSIPTQSQTIYKPSTKKPMYSKVIMLLRRTGQIP